METGVLSTQRPMQGPKKARHGDALREVVSWSLTFNIQLQ